MLRQARDDSTIGTPDLFPEVSVKRAATARSPIVGAEGLLGSTVVDSEGHRVGELLDILVDMHAGRVAYGVVVLDRAPEWSERLIAVPWNTMRMQADGDGVCVNAMRDWIERAPSMRIEAMNELLDRELAVFIHAYFGARPYWERAAQHC
ncbi:MAG TPA: PRC-barrel domain-containing protein [Casimicrobiaceae bacterium]|jgi:sporulation protein YlmC with PRC-barrel domain